MQVIINIVSSTCNILLIALGFSLIFSVTRFFHFAHAIVFAIGAYLTFVFRIWLGLPLSISIFLSLLLTTLFGCSMEFFIYRPLRKKGTSSLILLLASLGIYIVLQNIVSTIFGDDTKIIRPAIVQEGLSILGARIMSIQITTVITGLLLAAIVTLFLKRTKIGKSMRAVANDPELANISGINSNRIILWTFGIGSLLAAVAGILVALDVDMTPTMGMNALMLGVVAVVIGGIGSIPGIALGSLLLATAQHLGAWFIGSQWQDMIAFVILILFLLIRPKGIVNYSKC